MGVETLSVKQGIDSALFFLLSELIIKHMENKNEMNEERILAEEVSLEQPKRNQERKKGTRIPLIVLLVAVLVIAIVLLAKPVQRELFINEKAEQVKPDEKSVYRNKGLLKLRTLGQISDEERRDFLKTVPYNTTIRQMEIIYDNDKYVERFGKDEFDKYDKITRDKQYKESVVRQAVYEQYGEDVGLIAWLNSLTLQEKIDFLESNYQTAMNNFEYEWQKNDFESRVYDTESFDWYTIDDYTIPIPKTMYLSADTSYGFKYQFVQKKQPKYYSIMVSCHNGDFSWMSNFLSGQKLHYIDAGIEIKHLQEAVEFRASFKDEARQMTVYSHAKGMDMSNSKGPDFIDVGGQIVLHAEFDQTAMNPANHVDTYTFYSPTKYMIVTTNYPVTVAKEWKIVMENVIRGIRKVK